MNRSPVVGSEHTHDRPLLLVNRSAVHKKPNVNPASSTSNRLQIASYVRQCMPVGFDRLAVGDGVNEGARAVGDGT
jgi:hypothetical protein